MATHINEYAIANNYQADRTPGGQQYEPLSFEDCEQPARNDVKDGGYGFLARDNQGTLYEVPMTAQPPSYEPISYQVPLADPSQYLVLGSEAAMYEVPIAARGADETVYNRQDDAIMFPTKPGSVSVSKQNQYEVLAEFMNPLYSGSGERDQASQA